MMAFADDGSGEFQRAQWKVFRSWGKSQRNMMEVVVQNHMGFKISLQKLHLF